MSRLTAAALAALAGACADPVAPRAPVAGPARAAVTAATPAVEITATDLVPLGLDRTPVNLNARGELVGSCQDRVSPAIAVWLTGTAHAFLWSEAGGYRDLGTLGGAASCAAAVNDRGQVVGYSLTASGAIHAFVWTAEGGIRDLTTPAENQISGGYYYPFDINTGGTIVGTHVFGDFYGLVMDTTGTKFGPNGIGYAGRYTGVNDAGQIVGTLPVGYVRSFLVDASGCRTLEAPPGTVLSGYTGDVYAFAINGGTIVGSARGALAAAPGSPATRWTFATGAAPALLADRNSGKCLDVPGGDRSPGARVIIWECHGGENQRWTLPPAGAAGEVRVLGDRCLDALGAAGQDGDAIVSWECHGGENQRWTHTAAGELRGINGKCLDVAGASTADGATLILYACHGGANQRFDARPAPATATVASAGRVAP